MEHPEAQSLLPQAPQPPAVWRPRAGVSAVAAIVALEMFDPHANAMEQARAPASRAATKGSGQVADGSPMTKVEYRFIDSSVAPQYHRSYTIDATTSQLHVVVDSYGKVLAEKEYPMTATAFERLAKLAAHCRICPETENRGCTGGRGERVAYWVADRPVFTAATYHCGGTDYGALCGDVAQFAAEIKALVPDLQQLRETQG